MPESKSFFSSPHQSLLTWAIVVTLIVAGAYLSRIAYLGHEWLSRAGCLIVILGIWSGLGSLIQERILLSRLRGRRRNAIVRARAELESKEAEAAEIDREIDDIEGSFDEQASHLSQKLKVSLGTLEVSILITGTFLWGFGDIIAELLFAAEL
ncbi:MAG: hypothetical protein ACU84Q_21150 [Gammaproteobacteria bacterium]